MVTLSRRTLQTRVRCLAGQPETGRKTGNSSGFYETAIGGINQSRFDKSPCVLTAELSRNLRLHASVARDIDDCQRYIVIFIVNIPEMHRDSLTK
jgi:hypothetical protein